MQRALALQKRHEQAGQRRGREVFERLVAAEEGERGDEGLTAVELCEETDLRRQPEETASQTAARRPSAGCGDRRTYLGLIAHGHRVQVALGVGNRAREQRRERFVVGGRGHRGRAQTVFGHVSEKAEQAACARVESRESRIAT